MARTTPSSCTQVSTLRGENDRLTRVYHEDETGSVYVTEDVKYLEEPRWREMLRLDYFERRW